MKEKFLNTSINLIKKSDPKVTDVKLDEIRYGLEGIYLSFTKFVIIFGLALCLGMVKEVFLLLVLYNIIRFTAFGLHATKSIYCLITSLIMFIGGAYLCEILKIILPIKIVISIVCVLCIFKYAPADTVKRPIINPKKRRNYKIITTVTSIIFTILIVSFNSNIISNFLLIGMVEAVLMIHPLVYKIFNLPYDNYKKYQVVNNL